MSRPFSVTIFLADGTPEGLRVASKDNWNGCGVVCPRPVLKASMVRPEFAKPGVYVLLGTLEDSPLPTVYIGEADPVGERLKQHDAKKEFWAQAVFFTGNLNKAHVQYLETKLLEIARTAKRCMLENANMPSEPTLSDVDKANANGFLEEMLLCFGVLGVDIFEVPQEAAAVKKGVPKKNFKASSKGITALGYLSPNGFVVSQGSQAIGNNAPSLQKGVVALREKLIDLGVLEKQEKHLVFTQDYEFGSPSTASSVVLARPSNGRDDWKDEMGLNLNQLALLESNLEEST